MNRGIQVGLGVLVVIAPIVVLLMVLGTMAVAAWVFAVLVGLGVMALLVSAAIAMLRYKIRMALLYPVMGIIAGGITLALMFNGRWWLGLVGVAGGLAASAFLFSRQHRAFVQLAEDADQHQTYVDASGRTHTFVVADHRTNPEPLNHTALAVGLNLLGVFVLLTLLLLLFWGQEGLLGILVRVCWGVFMVGVAWVMLIAAQAASQSRRLALFLLAILGFLASLGLPALLLWLQAREFSIASLSVGGWSVVFGFIAVLTLATGGVAVEAERRTGIEVFSQCLSPSAMEEVRGWLNRHCPQPLKVIATAAQEAWTMIHELYTVAVRK